MWLGFLENLVTLHHVFKGVTLTQLTLSGQKPQYKQFEFSGCPITAPSYCLISVLWVYMIMFWYGFYIFASSYVFLSWGWSNTRKDTPYTYNVNFNITWKIIYNNQNVKKIMKQTNHLNNPYAWKLHFHSNFISTVSKFKKKSSCCQNNKQKSIKIFAITITSNSHKKKNISEYTPIAKRVPPSFYIALEK